MNNRHLLALLQSNFYTLAVVFDNPLPDAPWDGAPARPQPARAPSHGQPQAPVMPSNYAGTEKTYTYKCPDDIELELGDKVLVDSPRNGLCIATVVRKDDFADIDLNADFTYKWIVQKVDRTRYDDMLDKEAKFSRLLTEAERVKQREAVMESFKSTLPEGGDARKLFDEALNLFGTQGKIGA